jgi:hypothetical protein
MLQSKRTALNCIAICRRLFGSILLKRATYSRQRPNAIYLNSKVKIEPNDESKDEEKQKLLWKASLDFFGLEEEELSS